MTAALPVLTVLAALLSGAVARTGVVRWRYLRAETRAAAERWRGGEPAGWAALAEARIVVLHQRRLDLIAGRRTVGAR